MKEFNKFRIEFMDRNIEEEDKELALCREVLNNSGLYTDKDVELCKFVENEILDTRESDLEYYKDFEYPIDDNDDLNSRILKFLIKYRNIQKEDD